MLGKLQQLTDAIANTKLTADQIYALESIPRSNYVIDPVAASIALGGHQPARLGAIEAALRLQDYAGSREANATLALVDRLLRKLDMSSNLAGVGPVPPSVGMQLSDDVFYKRQHKKSKRPGQKGQMVEFATFKNTPMMDFDLPTIDHANLAGQIQSQVNNLGELEDRIVEYRERYPEAKLRLYATPGGFRIFDTAQSMTPAQHLPQSEFMGSDPMYVKLNQQALSAKKKGGGYRWYDEPGFRVRVSDKPRPDDFVAIPIVDYASEAPQNPRSVQIIREMHDKPIDAAYLGGGVPASARKMLADELPTASKALQGEIRRRLRL